MGLRGRTACCSMCCHTIQARLVYNVMQHSVNELHVQYNSPAHACHVVAPNMPMGSSCKPQGTGLWPGVAVSMHGMT